MRGWGGGLEEGGGFEFGPERKWRIQFYERRLGSFAFHIDGSVLHLFVP